MRNPEGPEFEAVVDAVVKRLQSGFGGGIPMPIPKGEPDLERSQLPWDPLDEGPVPSLRRRSLQIAGMDSFCLSDTTSSIAQARRAPTACVSGP